MNDIRQQWFDTLEKAGFNENERLVIERLSKPYVESHARQARQDEVSKSLVLAAGMETVSQFAHYQQERYEALHHPGGKDGIR